MELAGLEPATSWVRCAPLPNPLWERVAGQFPSAKHPPIPRAYPGVLGMARVLPPKTTGPSPRLPVHAQYGSPPPSSRCLERTPGASASHKLAELENAWISLAYLILVSASSAASR
jgi:hypothetical protein